MFGQLLGEIGILFILSSGHSGARQSLARARSRNQSGV